MVARPIAIALIDGLQHLTLNLLGHALTMSYLLPALALAIAPREWKRSEVVGMLTQLQWDAHDWLEEMELHRFSLVLFSPPASAAASASAVAHEQNSTTTTTSAAATCLVKSNDVPLDVNVPPPPPPRLTPQQPHWSYTDEPKANATMHDSELHGYSNLEAARWNGALVAAAA